MKRLRIEKSLRKKINKTFLMFLFIIMVVTINVYPMYIEGKIEQDNKLENSEHIVMEPSYRDLFARYFFGVRNEFTDIMSNYNSEGDEVSFERDVEIMYLWDKRNDSELASLKNDIEVYARNNPNDPDLMNYSELFLERNTNPRLAIKLFEEIRLECLEASRRTENGSFPGILGIGFMRGLIYNFTFYDMGLNEQIANILAYSSGTDYYIYYSPSPMLRAVFAFVFSLGILLPWYLGFMLYQMLKKGKSTE